LEQQNKPGKSCCHSRRLRYLASYYAAASSH